MSITQPRRKIAEQLVQSLQRMGFRKKPLNFVYDHRQSYCTLGEAWNNLGEPIWVEIYIGPYFSSSRPIWVGLAAETHSAISSATKMLKGNFLSMGDPDWLDYDLSTPRKLSQLRQHSFNALEEYEKYNNVWLGRYFEESSTTAEDCFVFLRQLLGSINITLRKRARRGPCISTTKQSVIFTRSAQSAFREDVQHAWNYRCAVTQLDLQAALRASHILPWADYPEHRTDPNNGLLLNGMHDALFDRGFISFEDNGRIKISASIPKEWIKLLHVKHTDRLRPKPNPAVCRFLKRHRDLIYQGD